MNSNSDRKTLELLIDLLEDDTAEVREEVISRLKGYNDLETELLNIIPQLDDKRAAYLQPIFEEHRRFRLKESWLNWQSESDEYKKLEIVLNSLAEYQLGANYPVSLINEVDRLSEEFLLTYDSGNELDLIDFLFARKRFIGNKEDYYDPMNSNLVRVIETKKGLPISLALLLMLVGRKLGFHIEGCNFPGHFLAKVNFNDTILLVDCFNGGLIIDERNFYSLAGEAVITIKEIIGQKTRPEVIIHRVLGNLESAYEKKSDKENSELFRSLIEITPL